MVAIVVVANLQMSQTGTSATQTRHTGNFTNVFNGGERFCKPLVGSSNLSPGTALQCVGPPYPDAKLFPVAADLDRSRDPCGRLLFCPANPLGSGAVWLASLRVQPPAQPLPGGD
jgi:hypothetical protein